MANIEEMLSELVKYSRGTKDYVKVEKMTRIVASQIEREIRDRQIAAMSAQLVLVEELANTGGHA